MRLRYDTKEEKWKVQSQRNIKTSITRGFRETSHLGAKTRHDIQFPKQRAAWKLHVSPHVENSTGAATSKAALRPRVLINWCFPKHFSFYFPRSAASTTVTCVLQPKLTADITNSREIRSLTCRLYPVRRAFQIFKSHRLCLAYEYLMPLLFTIRRA